MDVRFYLQGIQFAWNDQKATSNRQKHGISFELACEAFFDPFVKMVDVVAVEDEMRESILGMTRHWTILYVVYVWRGEMIRLISARLATRQERKQYENG